jgi:hypothetical protein
MVDTILSEEEPVELIQIGRTILSYQRNANRKCAGFACCLKIVGRSSASELIEKCYCVEASRGNSMLFEDKLGADYASYDVFVAISHRVITGDYGVTILSSSQTIFAHELCQILGGGGHKTIGGADGVHITVEHPVPVPGKRALPILILS